MATQPAAPVQFPSKKPFIRRFGRDTSQRTRHIVQGLFLLLNGWIGIQFYLWARYYERGGAGLTVPRPAGVEGWLPIAGLMNTKYLLITGRVPEVHPAAMYLFIGFMLISLLLKKAFCSWLCPVGTFSEYLWRIGRRFFGRNLRLPRWFDIPLRGLKYILLGLFVAVIGVMSAEALDGFMQTPYGLLVDVKMMNFFRDMGITAAVVIALLVLLSMLVQNFWCRYLCPYGALLGLTSFFSPMRIRRNQSACIDCAKCAKACPSSLPVDKLITIKSAECTGCLECVAVCPAQGALQMSLPVLNTGAQVSPRRTVPAWAMAMGIAVLFFGIVGFAKTAGYWTTDISRSTYEQLVPHANEARHPMPGD